MYQWIGTECALFPPWMYVLAWKVVYYKPLFLLLNTSFFFLFFMFQSKTLTALTMDYTLTDALEDIATMTDLLYGTSNFMSVIRDLPDLKDLPSLMHKIPGLVDSVIKLGLTDLSW